MPKGDELIDELLAGGSQRDPGVVTNDLLRELHRGFPLERLRRLMQSDRLPVAKAGIWIAAELGSRGQPLLDEVAKLLGHEEPYIRYYAIDSVLTCADERHGPAIAAVLLLSFDGHEAVRVKVLEFLVRASDEQLRASIPSLRSDPQTEADVADRLRWLLAGESMDHRAVATALQSSSSLVRRFGAAAALRYGLLDGDVLTLAESSADPEIREVVKSELAARRRRQQRGSDQ